MAPLRRAWLFFGLAIVFLPTGQAGSSGYSSLGTTSSGGGTEVVVSTVSDAVNGDVSSPAVLLSTPGPDGISLREAILAANNAPGPHAITFSPDLAGETIYLTEALPSLTRDYVSIEGFDEAGEPAVTLDGDGIEWGGTTLNVVASHVAIRRLRFTRIRDNSMITVAAGAREDGSAAPQTVSDVVVEDNVFDQTGYSDGGCGVAAGTEMPALYATVRNVVFKGNRFINLTRQSDSAVGVSIGASGNHTTVEGVLVYDNEFDGTQLPIEINSYVNSNNTITGTQIVHNTFTNSTDGNSGMTMLVQGELGSPVSPPPASGNTISHTLVEGNLSWQNSGSFLSVYGGTFNAVNNHVTDLRVIDNVLDGGYGLRFTGGTVEPEIGGNVTNNSVSGVRIQNNTLYNADFAVEENWGDASGNSVSDLQISNSIVWGGSVSNWLTTDMVSYSVFCTTGFPGVNGNICPTDPRFVDPAGVDFHLQADSPAIDAGTSDGDVPVTDRECRARVDDAATDNSGGGSFPYYDIGAYEYDAPEGSCTSPDTTPPVTNIDAGPEGAIDDTTPSFNFSSEDGSTFRCRLDSGDGVSCVSPYTTSALSDGPHTFYVWAIDEAGNADTTAATRSFTVDTAPPETTIDSGPSGAVNNPAPTFTFSSSETGSTFECRLDASAFAACSSPKTTTTLADGSHSFQVRATDQVGHVDTSPATRSFTVDTTPPETTIDSGPSGAVNNPAPTFTFSSSETGSTFECRVDAGAFAPCSSPKTVTLSDGTRSFQVRATDSAGNVDASPATRSFAVDTVPPETTINSAPSGTIRKRSATFVFSSSEPGSTFACRLDLGSYTACTSPKTVTLQADGKHSFQVHAVDRAGNVDASSATRSFTVDTVPPQTKITRAPSRTTGQRTTVFRFASSERRSKFQCKLDGGRFRHCASVTKYRNLKRGRHVLRVRAVDAAGNIDRSPAKRSWTIKRAG